MKVLVVGASRGIGLEFVRQYRHSGATVTATARDAAGLERVRSAGASAIALDVTDPASAAGLAWQVEGVSFDIVILNAGVMGPRHAGLEPPTSAEFDQVMHTNVLGPMWLLPQLKDAVAPAGKLAVLSSRMGSIGLRTSPNAWLYRASKAALNSVLKDASLAWAGRAICVAFHPGWVRTDMGGSGADLSVHDSVAGMRKTLQGLQPSDNGAFFNFDGKPLTW